MKLILLILSILLSFNCENTDPLDVEIYTLENGLTVMLNEDQNETSVFGAVVLDAGGKRDPSDATVIAHYLEHVLFKGTSELGTTDYEKEKVFLDSIAVLYDELALKKSDEERLSIQKHINKLSIKASEYAIPNEFTRLIEGMGGTGLNAGTSYDFVYYFNSLPSAQIEKWIDLYSHRFSEPVFRLFQSELETVYEEKNRAMDNPFRVFNETSRKYFFKNHPYGQQTILGSVDHLKTPSLSKMKQFYDKYYVPNNMSLILAGDFDKRSVKKMIKNKFSRLKKGASIEKINVQEDDFVKRGDILVEGTPVPHDILRILGVEELARYIVREVQSVYKLQGVYINDNLGIQDSIKHILDTNTKIRFPAADTVTIETAGAERLRITSGGDLLLGNHGSRIFDDSSGTNVVVDIYGGTTAGKRGILALGVSKLCLYGSRA